MAEKERKSYLKLIPYFETKWVITLIAFFIVVMDYYLGLSFGWLKLLSYAWFLLIIIYTLLWMMVIFLTK